MAYTQGSAFLRISKDELKKVFKGFLIALAGSALAYLSTEVVPMLQALDLPATELALVALLSTGVNFLMKLLSNTR